MTVGIDLEMAIADPAYAHLPDAVEAGAASEADLDACVRRVLEAKLRFIQMFGKIVMDVPAEAFEHALDEAKERKGPGAQDTDLDIDDLERADRAVPRRSTGSTRARRSRRIRRTSSAWRSTRSSRAWNGKRAIDYRRQNKISDDLGTAVNIQSMVFGNRGDDSGTGVAFTRDPRRARRCRTATTSRTRRERTSWPASATRCRIAELEQVDPHVVRGAARGDAHARAVTTATCATSSSRSRRAGSGSCRPASASAPRSASG